jgi:hypothetical protein
MDNVQKQKICILWSLIMDKHLWGLNVSDYFTIQYADDIVILINWKFPVSEVLQSAQDIGQ